MIPREKLIRVLERKPIKGRVPHLELIFFLTMEAFGKVHPAHRNYRQWFQMSEKEKQLHRKDIADLFITTARKYEHCAIQINGQPSSFEERMRIAELIREKSGNEFFLMVSGDATFGIPKGDNMEKFSYRLADEPEKVKQEAQTMVNEALERAQKYVKPEILDGFLLAKDYCLNTGPFLSPSMFSEFVSPYLAKLIKGYRDMGFYTIKHTDGNIMPVLEQLVQANPHALHSLDPQAGVDIAKVKKLVGDKVCLIGNVNCGLMQTGTERELVESVRYALKNGMPGGGYVFSTSNVIFTGLPLERYELMLDIWRNEGIYE